VLEIVQNFCSVTSCVPGARWVGKRSTGARAPPRLPRSVAIAHRERFPEPGVAKLRLLLESGETEGKRHLEGL